MSKCPMSKVYKLPGKKIKKKNQVQQMTFEVIYFGHWTFGHLGFSCLQGMVVTLGMDGKMEEMDRIYNHYNHITYLY